MFTLCMSRGPPHLQDVCRSKGFFCRSWREEWVVLYEDSTIAWYADKGLSRAIGYIRISDAPHLLAVGEFTRQVPRMPRCPRTCTVGQLIAIGCKTMHNVYWLMGKSSAEINDWMTAISNTLPPPPTLPLETKRLSLTIPQHDGGMPNGCVSSIPNGCAYQNGVAGRSISAKSNVAAARNGPVKISDLLKEPLNPAPSAYYDNKKCSTANRNEPATNTKKRNYNKEHAVMEGVVFNWGQGWGWTEVCNSTNEVVGASTVYCQAAEDCGDFGGYDDMDFSAFGDFCF